MSINHNLHLKKIIASDIGAIALSKCLYNNQEELRLKALTDNEFCFLEELYWIRPEIIHLVQPFLKAKYSHFISKGLIQKESSRYVIKVSNNDVDLIFIMNKTEIEFVLLDPLESFNIKQMSTDDDGQVIKEVCSFFVLYHTCKALDCITIERYWDFIRTLAIRYNFYPRIVFHEESMFNPEKFQLDSVEPGYCLYSGEPIKEGFFKDSKASSDFFNPRYSSNGLLGRKVLCYSESVQSLIDKEIKIHNNKLEEDFEKTTVNCTQEDKDGYSEVHPWGTPANIELSKIKELSLICAHELSKKIQNVAAKSNHTIQAGDITVNKILDHFVSYFLASRYAEHFDFLDVLLLVPNMKEATLKSFFKHDTKTFGRRSLLEQLIYRLSKKSSRNPSIKNNFYEKIISNGESSIPVGTLTKSDIEKLITLDKIDFLSYPKILNLYKQYDYKDEKALIKFKYESFALLNLINEMFKLIKIQGTNSNSKKSRSHLITLGLFQFHKNIIEQKIKQILQERINQAASNSIS